MKRRKFLQAFGVSSAAGLSGCSQMLGGEVESEELDCESTEILKVENGETEAYSENSWIQNMDSGVNADDILVSYDGEKAAVQYGAFGGIIDDSEERRGGAVKVGEHNGEEVFRYFRRKSMNEDYIEIETGLDRDGLGDTEFGEYEKICQIEKLFQFLPHFFLELFTVLRSHLNDFIFRVVFL
ncbi:hypothetical protein ACK3SF_00210 [Candidatus Nanosalina sp. VS9-1]|uniref:hypothetical protein n=1 Tax=Candidatus Nanosalina sp. VS9-1 TaxID=3388566 RepID=UPI0039DFFF9B